jgi:hypothetical protein
MELHMVENGVVLLAFTSYLGGHYLVFCAINPMFYNDRKSKIGACMAHPLIIFMTSGPFVIRSVVH